MNQAIQKSLDNLPYRCLIGRKIGTQVRVNPRVSNVLSQIYSRFIAVEVATDPKHVIYRVGVLNLGYGVGTSWNETKMYPLWC